MKEYTMQLEEAQTRIATLEEELQLKEFYLREAEVFREEAEKKAEYYASKCKTLREMFIGCIKQI